MSLKKNITYKTFIIIINLCSLFGEGIWVKHGWELFDYILDAKSASLGNSVTAYDHKSIQSSISNPFFNLPFNNNISITHQSRFGGIVNSELIGLQIKRNKKIINLNIIYQGISNIPDTRLMLLDWGLDGKFGTNDLGEGNGIIDEGERLDNEKIRYFNQHQFGLYSSTQSKIFGISIGTGYKFLSYFFDNHYALGFGLDVGFFKKINHAAFGLLVKNLPSSGLLWDSGIIEGTSPSLSLGLSYTIKNLEKYSIVIYPMFKVEVSSSSVNLDSHLKYKSYTLDGSFGLELIHKNLSVRFGRNVLNELTGGVGLMWDNIGVDYAFLNSFQSHSLGNHHLISLNFSTEWILSKISK